MKSKERNKESFLIESYISVGELVNVMYDYELSHDAPLHILDIYNSSNLSRVVLLKRLSEMVDFNVHKGETCSFEIKVGNESYLTYIYYAGIEKASNVLVWKNSAKVHDNRGITLRALHLKDTNIDFVAKGVCKSMASLFKLTRLPKLQKDIAKSIDMPFVILDMLAHLLFISKQDLNKSMSVISDLEDLLDFKDRYNLGDSAFDKSELRLLPKENWCVYLVYRLVGGICRVLEKSNKDLDLVYMGIMHTISYQVRDLVSVTTQEDLDISFICLSSTIEELNNSETGIQIRSKLYSGLNTVNLVVTGKIIDVSRLAEMYIGVSRVGMCYICTLDTGDTHIYASVIPDSKVVKIS